MTVNIGKKTWFRTDCFCDSFSQINTIADLPQITPQHFIIGNGSNTLFCTRNFTGQVCKLGGDFAKIEILENGLIEAGAGVLDSTFASFCAKNGISGFEFLSAIPGSIGGAIKMNAGCFGGEIAHTLEKIHIFNRISKQVKWVEPSLYHFEYRKSGIPPEDVILGGVFKFKKGNPSDIYAKMQTIKEEKKRRQPTSSKTGGSTFKNPTSQSAWWYITNTFPEGYGTERVTISPKHANFIINKGGASGEEIANLIRNIQTAVQNKYNILLETEIVLVDNNDTI